MTNVFDNLIIHLCKFSTLMTLPDGNQNFQFYESFLYRTESINGTMMAEQNSALTKSMSSSVEMIPLTFAEDLKAQMAIKIMFHLVHKHGDNLREVCIYLDCYMGTFLNNFGEHLMKICGIGG